MSWPADNISTDSLDAGSDTPPRGTFLKMAQAIKALIAGRGVANGVASLGADAKVPDAQMGRGVANGVASLGSGGKVPSAQLPSLWTAGDIKVSAVSAVPTGWLECDGAAVSRTTYSALFTAIGSTYGAGDGSTTFNVPDFRGRVVIGASASKAMGATGGSETHTLTVDEMPAHDHGASGAHGHGVRLSNIEPNGSFNRARGSSSSGSTQETSDDVITGGAHSHASAGGGGAHSIMQPYGVARVIIKT